jgi:predicted RNA-binding Zn ribbon-like protein
MTEALAATMKLVGGNPGLDFVNTVGGRTAGPGSESRVANDKLGDYRDLVAWARHAGLLSEARARGLVRMAERAPREAARVFARAAELREALHRLLRALMDGRRPDPADLAVLNAELAAMRSGERLVARPEGLRWEHDDAQVRLDSVLRPICRGVEGLLTSGNLSRVRACAGEGCGWLFLDRSKNRSRQWCTMEDCGNASKVRRFRERLRKS